MGQKGSGGHSTRLKWDKTGGHQNGFKTRWMALKIAIFRLIDPPKIDPDCATASRKAQGVAQWIWVSFLFFISPAQKISG
jgi:hypothetical protein